jgi:hypothetical protein
MTDQTVHLRLVEAAGYRLHALGPIQRWIGPRTVTDSSRYVRSVELHPPLLPSPPDIRRRADA